MAGERKSVSALTALLIALPFGLVLAWSLPTQGPSRAELAEALSSASARPVPASDLRDLSCDDPGTQGIACRWQQRVDGDWQARSGALAVSAGGWQLVER